MPKVGIVGAGGMGRVHTRHYKRIPGVEVVVTDTDEEVLSKFTHDLEVNSVASTEELLASCDVMDICLPTNLHLQFVKMCMEAKKPTLCEKPLALTSGECREMLTLSLNAGTLLMPGQVVRFFPEFRKAHDLIIAGKIGEPGAIRTRRGGLPPRGLVGWFGNPEQSGGVIGDLMVHDFDWIRWTFGEVERVFAQSLMFTEVKGIDYALVTLTLESGAIAHCEGTWADPGGFRVTFEASGSGGFLEYDSRVCPSLKTSLNGSAFNESPMLPEDDPYYLQLHAFLTAVESGDEPPVTAADGFSAVAIAEAAIESARTGKPIRPVRI